MIQAAGGIKKCMKEPHSLVISVIVIMSPRYRQHVSRTSNLYPATCVGRHMDTSCSSGTHVARPGVNAASRLVLNSSCECFMLSLAVRLSLFDGDSIICGVCLMSK